MDTTIMHILRKLHLHNRPAHNYCIYIATVMYKMTVYMTILFRHIPTPHPHLDLPMYSYTGIKSTRTLADPYPGQPVQGKSTHTHNGEVSLKAVTWLQVDSRLTRGEFNSYPGPIFNYRNSSTKYYSVFSHNLAK